MSLLFIISPMIASAQSHVKSAFDAIINCSDAKISEKHSLEKEPGSKSKTSQSDVYHFTLPAKRMNLIENVIKAFRLDSDMAYSINQGRLNRGSDKILLSVGKGGTGNIDLGELNSDYVYALFLAPKSEDPNGHNRYAYGMSYSEVDGKIVGKLVVTYGLTLNYRQQQQEERRNKVIHSYNTPTNLSSSLSQGSWFEQVMHHLVALENANPQTRCVLATKVYTLIKEAKKYPEATVADKVAVKDVLKGMMEKYTDPMLNQLLTQCYNNVRW